MDAIRKIVEHSTNPLTIELPEEWKDRKLEVIVLPVEETEKPQRKYDFSKFVGKMKWEGDAVVEQRKLRDEWD
jgi:hypothetical protein